MVKTKYGSKIVIHVPYTVNQLLFARTLLNFHDLITENKLVCGD